MSESFVASELSIWLLSKNSKVKEKAVWRLVGAYGDILSAMATDSTHTRAILTSQYVIDLEKKLHASLSAPINTPITYVTVCARHRAANGLTLTERSSRGHSHTCQCTWPLTSWESCPKHKQDASSLKREVSSTRHTTCERFLSRERENKSAFTHLFTDRTDASLSRPTELQKVHKLRKASCYVGSCTL